MSTKPTLVPSSPRRFVASSLRCFVASSFRPFVAFFSLSALLLPALPSPSLADALPLMTHTELQSVNPDGTSPFVASNSCPFILRGILLNDPEDLLSTDFVPDATSPNNGGQYQVFVQATAPGDRGGTALYMSQRGRPAANYYDEETWASELDRVTTADPGTGRRFRPGDYVEITANWAMHYNGKVNVNEGHNPDPAYNFSIRLLSPAVGLPTATPLVLADLVDDADTPIFDPTRATGGERWQGSRVRLDAIRLTETDPAGWNPDLPWGARLVTCADAAGRTFPLRLPRHSLGPAPATNRYFSATGILNQEGSDTAGYELIVQEIGPVLDLSFDETDGTSAIAYSADYAGYQLQISDDSGTTWTDAFPTVIIVHDSEAPPTRFYRLVLPTPAD